MSSMTAQQWHGVFPAITTPFGPDGKVDHGFLSGHARRLIASGCRGIVALGSLGEGATLTFEEKVEVLRTLVASVGDRVPVVAGISSLSTDEAVALARAAAGAGCNGLMVLPPYVYQGDWPEMRAHVSAILTATPLSCMLYNNPIAYGTDFIPEHVRQLCEHANMHAIQRQFGQVASDASQALGQFVELDLQLLRGCQADPGGIAVAQFGQQLGQHGRLQVLVAIGLLPVVQGPAAGALRHCCGFLLVSKLVSAKQKLCQSVN